MTDIYGQTVQWSTFTDKAVQWLTFTDKQLNG